MKRLLLRKEAHILRKIDQLKNEATDRLKRDKVERVMELMSQPKQWEVSNGLIIDVDTPETMLAREMKTMYNELNEKIDHGRIGTLERIKAFLETVDNSSLSKDVGTLLDRELQMLRNGADLGPELMDGLRTRLVHQFTKLIDRLNQGDNAGKQTVAAKFRLRKSASDQEEAL